MREDKKREYPEQKIQGQIADLFWKILKPPVLWLAIDHSNARNSFAGSIKKYMGVKKGTPDMMLSWRDSALVPVPGRVLQPCYVGWLEVKAPEGKLSDAQVEWREMARLAQHMHAVVRSVDDVLKTLQEWGVPHLKVT